jgi:hypothetical protein
MLGNNIESAKTFRLQVPLFTSDETIGTSGWPGKKYFFPDNPILNNSLILGIEANLSTSNGIPGDIPNISNNRNLNVTKTQATYIFVTIYDNELCEKFADIPLFSLYPNPGGTQKKINPYFGRINTRKSYCYIPANITELQDQYFVNLTFYYNPIN